VTRSPQLVAAVANPGASDGAAATIPAVYELCTSAGFSGPFRHFRPLRILQLTDFTLLMVIVVRIHAGEPPFSFSTLEDDRSIFVRILYRCLGIVRSNLLPLQDERAEHGFEIWN